MKASDYFVLPSVFTEGLPVANPGGNAARESRNCLRCRGSRKLSLTLNRDFSAAGRSGQISRGDHITRATPRFQGAWQRSGWVPKAALYANMDVR